MSRVFAGQKHLNLPKYTPTTKAPLKVARLAGPNADFTKAKTLTSWLFLKHGMPYKKFARKSTKVKNKLRAEYMADTRLASCLERKD